MTNDVVEIKLDKIRFLRFGHSALKKLFALTGKGFDEIATENFDMETLETVFFCGLQSDFKENGETFQLSDMENLLDQADSYKDIITALTKAFNNAFGNEIATVETKKN